MLSLAALFMLVVWLPVSVRTLGVYKRDPVKNHRQPMKILAYTAFAFPTIFYTDYTVR
jgi:hypothetical protein